jgi:hypothetical protein
MAELTRREALAAAWDKMDAGGEGEDVEVIEPPEGSVKDDTVAETPEGDEGVGVEKSADEPRVPDKILQGPKAEEKAKKPAKDNSQSKEVEAAQQSEVKEKPPGSWKPLARESWSKIPPEARAEISRRELEIQHTLSQTATIRKFANDFAGVVNPFSHIIRAQNSTPLKAVQNLMQTAAGLYQGTQHQKAAIIADILTNYGIDIQILDDYLSKNWNPGAGPGQRVSQPHVDNSPMPAWAQRIHAFVDSFEQKQIHEKEEMKRKADEEISKLESEPYFTDVQDDIADILKIAADRGRSMTLKEAFERAKLLNEDVQKAIKAKKLQNLQGKQKESQQYITRARRAASTLSGAPQGKVSGKDSGPKSRRQMLSEAWDAAEG